MIEFKGYYTVSAGDLKSWISRNFVQVINKWKETLEYINRANKNAQNGIDILFKKTYLIILY